GAGAGGSRPQGGAGGGPGARAGAAARRRLEPHPRAVPAVTRGTSDPLCTRQSVLFAKGSYEERWTRGSSPRVTGRNRGQSPSACPGLTRASIEQEVRQFGRRIQLISATPSNLTR